jgi:hypothetical protein
MTDTNTKKGKLDIALFMSNTNPKTRREKVSNITFFVKTAAVTAYNAAADDAARDATLIGALVTAVGAMTKGVLKSIDVGFVYGTGEAPPAANTFTFPFDKFLVQSQDIVNGKAVTSSIPARLNTSVNVGSDGISVIIDGAGETDEVSAYIIAYEGVVLSNDSNDLLVDQITISS